MSERARARGRAGGKRKRESQREQVDSLINNHKVRQAVPG